MKKTQIAYLPIALLLFLLLILGFSWSSTKLTYIEYVDLNSSRSDYILTEMPGDTIVQEFIMPYSILNSISVTAKQFERYNTSIYDVSLIHKASQTVLLHKECQGWELCNIALKRNTKVIPNDVYQVMIVTKEVTADTCIGYYVSDSGISPSEYAGKLTFNGNPVVGNISLSIQGGEPDLWWSGFILFIFCILFFTMGSAFYLSTNNQNPLHNPIIQCILFGLLIFALKYPFAYLPGCFNDELENLYAGHLISNGGVIYKDYISQHTPLLYYICSLFALTGADSEAQLRISYYIAEALIWSLLYHRFSPIFGKIKLLLMSLVITIGGITIEYLSTTSVLSDNLQALFLLILLLEFLGYLKDRSLKWDRCIIASLSFWGGVGVAFVSVFGSITIILSVVLLEIFHIKEQKISFKFLVRRYLKLIISFIIPPLIFIFYFSYNHILNEAIKQIYIFNIEVYSKYTNYGTNIIQPFISGIQNIANLFVSAGVSLIENTLSFNTVLIVAILLLLIVSLVLLLINQKYIEAIVLTLTILFSASRGCTVFHSCAAWTIILFTISFALTERISSGKANRIFIVGFCFFAMFLLYTFIPRYISGYLYKQAPISEQQKYIIDATEKNDPIFVDVTTAGDCLYYLYKDRQFANRLLFIHPWFMEWFEQTCVTDLINTKPKIAIYNDNSIIWNVHVIASDITDELTQNYDRLSDNSDDNWKYYTWIRRNQ